MNNKTKVRIIPAAIMEVEKILLLICSYSISKSIEIKISGKSMAIKDSSLTNPYKEFAL